MLNPRFVDASIFGQTCSAFHNLQSATVISTALVNASCHKADVRTLLCDTNFNLHDL